MVNIFKFTSNHQEFSTIRQVAILPMIIGSILLTPSALLSAATSENDRQVEQKLENTIEITGSRLKRVHLEGPSPLTIISREQIEQSGRVSISGILRGISANSFGSSKEQTGRAGGTQSQAGINLRGLGEQRTLVLVNGRRLANSPAIPDSQNLNMIPLAAVERIEVLKDGASSVYGSDAVGGVVNIILRRDLDANQLAIHIARPTQEGGDENYISLWGGQVNNRDSFTYAITASTRENVFNRDREITRVGLSNYGYLGSYGVTIANPNSQGPAFISQTFADPRCPTTLGTASFPDSVVENNLCKYNYARHSDHLPDTGIKSVYLYKDHVLDNGDSWFAQLTYSQFESDGTYAATPQVGGSVLLPTMASNNPNNPTNGLSINFDTDNDGIPDTLVNGPFDLDIYYRNVAGGLRETHVEDQSTNFSTGIEGGIKWFGGSNYKLGFQHNHNQTKELSMGLARRDFLQAAIDDGSFDIFAVNGSTDLNLAASFALESVYQSEFILSGLDFTLTTELGQLNASTITSAWGIDFKHHRYDSQFKDSFEGNQIDGRAGGGSAKGDRDIASFYSEINLPFSKELDVNFALRYDNYNDFGGEFSPKLGITWHINDSWLLRSSIGTGFRAPSLFELYSAANQSFPSIIDTLRCEAAGDADGNGVDDSEQSIESLPINSVCRPVDIQTVTDGNENLEAEKSKSASIGFVYQPDKNSRFSFNFYRQEFTNQIAQFPLFDLLEIEADNGSHSDIIRNQAGQIERINRQFGNYSGARATGMDIEFEYIWQTRFGTFNYDLDFSATLDYEIETIKGQGFVSIDGDIGRAGHRFTTGLGWKNNAWNARLNALVIPSMEQQETELGSWIPLDLQINYDLKFGGRVVFGIRNLLDDDPPTSQALGFPFYIASNADITGRVPYVRYIQTF